MESILREILNKTDYWFMKLQVNPIAHTPTVGDYMLTTPSYNYIIECKEIDYTKGYKTFAFSRLTQESELLKFSKQPRNIGLIIICMWKGRKDKSDYYILTIENFIKLKTSFVKKLMNEFDLQKNVACYDYIGLKKMFEVE